MGLHHLVGSSVGPGFDLQEKLKLAKNYSSFIRDKCCHLTLHLRLMEPNWWFNTVSLQLKALAGQGFELKPLTIRRRGHFKRQDSRSLSPKNQKVIFVSSHLKHLQQVRFFSARMVSVPVTTRKKNLGEKNRRVSVFSTLNFHFVLWPLKHLPGVFFCSKTKILKESVFGSIKFFIEILTQTFLE